MVGRIRSPVSSRVWRGSSFVCSSSATVHTDCVVDPGKSPTPCSVDKMLVWTRNLVGGRKDHNRYISQQPEDGEASSTLARTSISEGILVPNPRDDT
jgi:hypothetical protein